MPAAKKSESFETDCPGRTPPKAGGHRLRRIKRLPSLKPLPLVNQEALLAIAVKIGKTV